jgi:hypothetical protein
MREQYARETADQATDAERARGISPQVHAQTDRRRAAIQALISGGATEGERSAAQAALERYEASADSHAARMGRIDSEASSFGEYG